jgi:hypothetical protein
MRRDFATKITGGALLLAALMLWGGHMLLPHHLGTFFQASDFSAIHDHLHVWLWLFRVHLFGMIMTVAALVALGAALADSPSRVLVWPGVAVAAAGLVVGALAAAFYYHFGVWGAIEMNGKSPETIQAFVESLRIDTEYVTCLVRFGRVFSGLGLVILALGLLRGQLLPSWITVPAMVIGVAAMALTMLLPDRLELYWPVFHLLAAWLAATGIVILLRGLPGQPLAAHQSLS